MEMLMAMPPSAPPSMQMAPPMPMESPETGRVRTGLIVGGIGLIIWAFTGFGGFGFIGPLIVFIGGIILFTGVKAYPSAKGTATIGMILVLVGAIVGIGAYALTPNYLALTLNPNPTIQDVQVVLNALATALLLSFLGGLIAWIGVILMPIKLVTGASKGLTIAGGVMGILGALLVVVLVYTAVAAIAAAIAAGTQTDVTAALATLVGAVFGIILGAIVGFIGGLLAGIGYIIGRKRLVPATARAM